jgi:hypothetical protein
MAPSVTDQSHRKSHRKSPIRKKRTKRHMSVNTAFKVPDNTRECAGCTELKVCNISVTSEKDPTVVQWVCSNECHETVVVVIETLYDWHSVYPSEDSDKHSTDMEEIEESNMEEIEESNVEEEIEESNVEEIEESEKVKTKHQRCRGRETCYNPEEDRDVVERCPIEMLGEVEKCDFPDGCTQCGPNYYEEYSAYCSEQCWKNFVGDECYRPCKFKCKKCGSVNRENERGDCKDSCFDTSAPLYE